MYACIVHCWGPHGGWAIWLNGLPSGNKDFIIIIIIQVHDDSANYLGRGGETGTISWSDCCPDHWCTGAPVTSVSISRRPVGCSTEQFLSVVDQPLYSFPHLPSVYY